MNKYSRLDIKFRGALCYIDTYQEPYVPEGDLPEWLGVNREEYIERLRNTPTYLCRIRHFDTIAGALPFVPTATKNIRLMSYPMGIGSALWKKPLTLEPFIWIGKRSHR